MVEDISFKHSCPKPLSPRGLRALAGQCALRLFYILSLLLTCLVCGEVCALQLLNAAVAESDYQSFRLCFYALRVLVSSRFGFSAGHLLIILQLFGSKQQYANLYGLFLV